MATREIQRPVAGVLYGLTHQLDGSPIIREPKLLKVGIGIPKGNALNVWIGADGFWRMQRGYKKDDIKVATFKTRAACEAKFAEAYKDAPICPYPRKLNYFSFTRPVVMDGVEQYVPDFDAIEAHGANPTEIDIVILDDEPFQGAYQMWSTSELKCSGDGINALRVITMGDPKDALVKEAIEAGEKSFPIVDGCWTCGCQYSKATTANGKDRPSECKPGGDLRFQLASNIRVGGTAFYHSTGMRTISGLFSSLYRIKTLTGGRLAGIPLKMTLRPFRANHNGQPSLQYAVGLEFRAPDVKMLKTKLMEAVFELHQLATGPAPKMLNGPTEPAAEEVDETPAAAAIAAEFYPETSEEEAEAEDFEAKVESAGGGVKGRVAAATGHAPKPEAEKPEAEKPKPPVIYIPTVDSMPEKGVGEVGQSVYFGAHQLTLQADGTWQNVGLAPKGNAKKEQEKW